MAKPTRSRSQPPQGDGPRYKVLVKSYIDGRMCGPGTEIDEIVYHGIPGRSLEPLNEEAVDAVEQAKDARDAARKAAGLPSLPDKAPSGELTGAEGRGGKKTPKGPSLPA